MAEVNAHKSPAQLEVERLKYVTGFNDMMVKIWKEQILLLNIVNTGALYNSVVALDPHINGKVTEIFLSWDTYDYGVYQDRGTGREVPIGNPGDIGRDKVREARPWITEKYYSSYMNIRDFFAQNLGKEFCAAIPFVLQKSML